MAAHTSEIVSTPAAEMTPVVSSSIIPQGEAHAHELDGKASDPNDQNASSSTQPESLIQTNGTNAYPTGLVDGQVLDVPRYEGTLPDEIAYPMVAHIPDDGSMQALHARWAVWKAAGLGFPSIKAKVTIHFSNEEPPEPIVFNPANRCPWESVEEVTQRQLAINADAFKTDPERFRGKEEQYGLPPKTASSHADSQVSE